MGLLKVWTKNVPLLVKLLFHAPVRRTALNYFFGGGGRGRRPVESADPSRGSGVRGYGRAAIVFDVTFKLYGAGGGGREGVPR